MAKKSTTPAPKYPSSFSGLQKEINEFNTMFNLNPGTQTYENLKRYVNLNLRQLKISKKQFPDAKWVDELIERWNQKMERVELHFNGGLFTA